MLTTVVVSSTLTILLKESEETGRVVSSRLSADGQVRHERDTDKKEPLVRVSTCL